MRVLEWREAARADLLAIVDYISDDNPEAAQQLKDDIEAKVAKLPEHPKLYRPGSCGRHSGNGRPKKLRGSLRRRCPRGVYPACVARCTAVAADVSRQSAISTSTREVSS